MWYMGVRGGPGHIYESRRHQFVSRNATPECVAEGKKCIHGISVGEYSPSGAASVEFIQLGSATAQNKTNQLRPEQDAALLLTF